MERQFDWDRLRVFKAVAEAGSLNAAAAQLAVSNATVARSVEDLERSFGQNLLIRSTRGVELTPFGMDVLKVAQSMSDSAEAIASRASDSKQITDVVICAQDAMATYWLAPRLQEFLQANPDIRVLLKVVPDTPNLADGDGDISIQYEEPAAPNIVFKPLGWLHYVLYASPGYLRIHGMPETMFDLGRHRFMMLTGYNKQRDAWASKTPHWLEVLNRAFQSNSSTVVLQACAGDGGIAPMPSYVSEFETRVEPLVHIPPLASARFWLAYTERVRSQPQYEPVLTWLRGCFDPKAHPCFREVYVPPRSSLRPALP